MTPVDFTTKDLERILKWFGLAFSKDIQFNEDDTKLSEKIKVMYNEEKSWDEAESTE